MGNDAGLLADLASARHRRATSRRARLIVVAIGERDADALRRVVKRCRPRSRAARRSSILRLRHQRLDQTPVLDHVRERFARRRPRRRKSGRSAAPRRRAWNPVTTMSRIGCASRATASHTPMRLEQPPRRRRDRRGARPSPATGCAEGRIGHRHRERRPSAWRSAMASARPAKPPPPITTSDAPVRCLRSCISGTR